MLKRLAAIVITIGALAAPLSAFAYIRTPDGSPVSSPITIDWTGDNQCSNTSCRLVFRDDNGNELAYGHCFQAPYIVSDTVDLPDSTLYNNTWLAQYGTSDCSGGWSTFGAAWQAVDSYTVFNVEPPVDPWFEVIVTFAVSLGFLLVDSLPYVLLLFSGFFVLRFCIGFVRRWLVRKR